MQATEITETSARKTRTRTATIATPKSKKDQLVDLLRAKGGASVQHLSEASRLGEESVRKAAMKVQAAFPNTLSFRLIAGLLSASDDVLAGKLFERGWHERQEAWLNKLGSDLKAEYTPQPLLRRIEEALRELAEAGEDQALTTTLLQHLIRNDSDLAREFVSHIRAHPKSSTRLYLGIALSELLNSAPAEGQTAARSFLDDADPELRFEAAKAFGALIRRLDTRDLELVEIALRSDNFAVVSIALRAIHRNRMLESTQVIDLAKKANIGASQQLADGLLMLFGDQQDGLVAKLSPEDVSHFLGRLAQLETLEGHWIEEFVAFASFHFPDLFLEFVFDRMDRAVISQAYAFRPLNYGPWMGTPLRLHASSEAPRAFDRLWTWFCKHPRQEDYFFKTNIGNLFEALFAGGFDKLAGFLDAKLSSAALSDLERMGEILQEAPNHFVFDQRIFVTRLLERCSEFGADLVEQIESDLYRSAAYGMRSGTPGFPMKEDVQQRDKSKEAMTSISRLSPAYSLYYKLLQSAEERIARSLHERVALDDD